MAKIDLNNVLTLMINEETTKANTMLKKWFAEQTRAIHESMLTEDEHEDNIKGNQKDIEGEEFFNEDDLEKAPKDDITQVTTDPDVIQDQFGDLKDDLARLQKEFEEITGKDEDTDKVPAEDDQVQEGLEMKPVASRSNSDGVEVGSKTSIKGNRRSTVPARNNRDNARPVQVKNPASKGYSREKAPEVKDAGVGSNARRKWSDDTQKLSREGNSKAELNKNYSKENDKSVLGNRSK